MYIKKAEDVKSPVIRRISRTHVNVKRMERDAQAAVAQLHLDNEPEKCEPRFRRDYMTGRYFSYTGGLV